MRVDIDVGKSIADSNDLFGATVELAARLCQFAEPAAISSAVQDRIRDLLHVTNIGPCHLKGLLQPVDIYGIEWRWLRNCRRRIE